MKKWILLSVMLGAVSLSSLAQDDDMYFVPTKKNVARDRATYGVPADTYYSGSARSVDEYNRRWVSSYEVLPVDTGDIISFAGIEGIYPDSLGDFSLTQRMTRWDGYEPSSAYWAGYSRGYFDSWGWHSPWYYSSYYPWYDPWYYDSWYWGYGWYDPFYYSWYSPYYYRPWYYYSGYYYGGGAGYLGHYSPGTSNHGRISGSASTGFASGRTRNFSSGTFGSSRSLGTAVANRSGSYGGSRTGTTTNSTRTRTSGTGAIYSNSNGNFGGSSSNAGSSFGSSRSAASTISGSGSSSSSGGGGSFGGGGSVGGGGGGGSRSGGGGGGGFGSGRR